jgi:PQQ-dependent catabolism-associated beta-propeller protein
VMINTSETTNMTHFIDTKTFEVTDNVLVDARPRFAEFSSDGKQLWVSAEIGGTVSVIDPAAKQIIKKIEFAIPGVNKETIQPVGIRILKDHSRAFVALGPANRIAVVNAQTFEVEKYLLVGQRVWQLAFTPDEKQLFTTNGNSNDVSVVDVVGLKVVKSIKTGRLPWGVAIKP